MKREEINLNVNDIVINIIGCSASGKTTIQEIIEMALTEHGFNVKSEYIDGENRTPIERRINGLISKNTNITLNEVSAYRSLVYDEIIKK